MNRVQELLGLSAPPIAIGFLDAPPAGVAQWTGGPTPSGCTFWRYAMQGQSFYTVPSDHYNCAVGAHTHAVSLPAERAKELEDTVGFMVANHYIEMKEVPGIPVLPKTPAAVAYAPVDDAKFAADAVLLAADPNAAMLLYEAALRAGAGNALTNVLGRPGCAVLPLAGMTGSTSLSFGCKGNRTFTGLPASQLYVAIPGKHWGAVAQQVEVVCAANAAMGQYYDNKKSLFPIVN
ncbi:MAG: DUF169 domain-containing protein [Bryobacteraceae bacterium]